MAINWRYPPTKRYERELFEYLLSFVSDVHCSQECEVQNLISLSLLSKLLQSGLTSQLVEFQNKTKTMLQMTNLSHTRLL